MLPYFVKHLRRLVTSHCVDRALLFSNLNQIIYQVACFKSVHYGHVDIKKHKVKVVDRLILKRLDSLNSIFRSFNSKKWLKQLFITKEQERVIIYE